MPRATISFTPAVLTPSPAVQEVADAVSMMSGDLLQTVVDGSVRVDPLREVLRPVLVKYGFTPDMDSQFAVKSLSWVARTSRIAVSVHGGRAHTNNEVLLALLAASAQRGVDWLIAVLPERYKNGPTFDNVQGQVEELSDAPGIDLDLIGVTLVAF